VLGNAPVEPDGTTSMRRALGHTYVAVRIDGKIYIMDATNHVYIQYGIDENQFNFIGSAQAKSYQLGGHWYTEFEMTPAENWKKGAVWNKRPIVTSRSFYINFQAYFGAKTGGADGIMFVLQNKSPSAIGQTGGHYLAYDGITPSMGVEFDTFYYPPEFEDRKDIPQDHIAIVKDGNINNPISNRVPALASGLPIDDNKWHDITITYDVNSHQVQVFFDTQLRLTQNVGTPVNTPTVYGDSRLRRET
jgi:hypothetical protein